MANMSRVFVRSLDHVDIMTEDCSVLSNKIDDQSMYPWLCPADLLFLWWIIPIKDGNWSLEFRLDHFTKFGNIASEQIVGFLVFAVQSSHLFILLFFHEI